MASPPNSIRSVGAVEHAQTFLIDQNLSLHQKASKKPSGILKKSRSFSSGAHFGGGEVAPLLLQRQSSSASDIVEYGASERRASKSTIRFQVVVWYVGRLDVVEGRVPMTFRVTIFWNADSDGEDDNDEDSVGTARSHHTWAMHGRQKAFQRELKDVPLKTVDVPPVSILNVVTFDTIGSPEVSMLQEDTRLMRWTCMYRATLIQDSWTVENFPHDQHDLTLKLAILAHRNRGRQWDRNKWKIALATDEDSQGTTRVPYGLVVDQVKIPEFIHNKGALAFDIRPLEHGPTGNVDKDEYLEVKFSVLRDSGYYDKNIMPLLGLLNLVAVSVLCLGAEYFFQRGLLLLNIAFSEIGIRMTTDSHLPSVAYQIKMQRILNEYFFGLLLLVLESVLVYVLHVGAGWSDAATNVVDGLAGIAVVCHNSYTLLVYYWEARRTKQMLPYSKSGKLG